MKQLAPPLPRKSQNLPMKTRVCLFLTLAAFASAFGQERIPTPLTVDQIVAKNVKAKGGAAALQALQSTRLTGKLLVNGGQLQLGYAQTKKRPGNIRGEVTMQGMTGVQAFDGTTGWKIMPFQGRKDPEKMAADDTKELVADAEIDGPLVDWQAKGSTVEYLGTEDVDGTPALKLKVTRKNGDVTFVYLDPDEFLEIRTLTQRTVQGAQVEIETDMGEYEKVGGVFLPFAIESGPKGATEKAKIVIDKGDANVPVDDSVFKFPTAAATPAK